MPFFRDIIKLVSNTFNEAKDLSKTKGVLFMDDTTRTGCIFGIISMIYITGPAFLLLAFFLDPSDEFKKTATITGVVFLIIAALFTLWLKNLKEKSREEADQARLEQLKKQRQQESEERALAEATGLEKYHQMDIEDAIRYKNGVKAMQELGFMLQSSVYQEKEKDWAVMGGIADGLAGPIAGIATAANVMQENAKIRAENEARRQWGVQQNQFMQNLALQAQRKSPTPLTMSEIKSRFSVDMTWSPKTLFSYLTILKKEATVDPITGAATVKVDWKQNDRTICVDGALRAKLYSEDKKCVGCAYLVLPKTGTSGLQGNMTGICAEPKRPTIEPSDNGNSSFMEKLRKRMKPEPPKTPSYTVKLEPIDLWELKGVGYSSLRETDKISEKEHRAIVAEYKSQYLKELEG